MMRSLYSGVSGLKNHQTRMDVIGNNISNVNTVGFKSSRTVFQDVFSQTSAHATGPSFTMGGTNPIQIGLGVKLGSIDVLHNPAPVQRTDNPSDLAIQGDGFFIIQVPDGSYQYTRLGNFTVDEAGNLCTIDGYYVMGWMGYGDPRGEDTADAPAWNPPKEIYDTVKNPDIDPPKDGEGAIVDGIVDTSTENNMGREWDPELNNGKGGWELNDEGAEGWGRINVHGFTDIAVGKDGKVTGLDGKGKKQTIGYIVLSTFTNNGGLEKQGNSLYAESENSGRPTFYTPATNGAGEVYSGGLEMSNVDLAEEFTDMIVTQRGFQANSRVITTSDTMLEELVNLKR